MYRRTGVPLKFSACSIVISESSRTDPATSSSIRVIYTIDDDHAVEQLFPYLEDTLIWIQAIWSLAPQTKSLTLMPAGNSLSCYLARHLHPPMVFVCLSFDFSLRRQTVLLVRDIVSSFPYAMVPGLNRFFRARSEQVQNAVHDAPSFSWSLVDMRLAPYVLTIFQANIPNLFHTYN